MKQVTQVRRMQPKPSEREMESFLFSRGWRNERGAEGVGESIESWHKPSDVPASQAGNPLLRRYYTLEAAFAREQNER